METEKYIKAKKDAIIGLVLTIILLICEFLPYYSCIIKADTEEATEVIGSGYYSVANMPICWGFILITIFLLISWYTNYQIISKSITTPNIENIESKKNVFLFKRAAKKGRFIICSSLLLLVPLFTSAAVSFSDWAMDESGYWGFFHHSISYYLFPIVLIILLIHSIIKAGLPKTIKNNHL